MPSGRLAQIGRSFLGDREFSILGCNSFEERGAAVVSHLGVANPHCRSVQLLQIADPLDAFPDYSSEIRAKLEIHKAKLQAMRSDVDFLNIDLLAPDDTLYEMAEFYLESHQGEVILLDISCLPKRVFCYLVKKFLGSGICQDLIITYSMPGTNGHFPGHLAEDPLPCEHLPGFSAPLPPVDGNTLVISVGFELLNLGALIDLYQEEKSSVNFIFPFPSHLTSMQRGWETLRQIVPARGLPRDRTAVISAWDTEQVLKTLLRWNDNSEGLTFAPFGPKPHSLGMAIFAAWKDCGMYYSQPKSYNPRYSSGMGEIWAYVIKWEGIACFERPARSP